MTNPLLAEWQTEFQLPPFAQITDADFAPAFEAAMAAGRAAYAAIAANPDAPTFANTIGAMEQADALLDRVAGVFFNLASSDSTPRAKRCSAIFRPSFRPIRPRLSITARCLPALPPCGRAAKRWPDTRGSARSDAVSAHVLRAGAALEGDDAARLTEVKSRLASLGTSFTQNLLADERDWMMPLDDLAGLPDFVVASARAAAEERGQAGHVVTLNRSLIVPFLQFSARRDLRQRAYEAWVARGANGGATDNRAIAAETLALRAERAALLGYETFARYKLETEMARTPMPCARC
jgi:peptidyl-dipeptidase Dcp